MQFNIKIPPLAPVDPTSQRPGLPPKTILRKTISNRNSDRKPGTLLASQSPTMVPSKNINAELQKFIGPNLSSWFQTFSTPKMENTMLYSFKRLMMM